ncbi:TPA: hypothetical protein ACJYNI_001150 [Neisseria gonorrhoeae]
MPSEKYRIRAVKLCGGKCGDNTRRVAAFAKLFRKHTGGVDV